MPFDFDDDQMSEDQQPKKPEPAEAPKPVRPKRTVQEPVQDELEFRMLKSQCYWDILKQPLFEGGDDAALEVEEEVFGFVREKLAELMGGSKPKRGRKPKAPEPVARSKPVTVFSNTGQPAAEAVVGGDPGAHALDDERGLAGVLQGETDDHLARLGVEVGGDLAVEVGGEPVADVGLDQSLVVVRARCARGSCRS